MIQDLAVCKLDQKQIDGPALPDLIQQFLYWYLELCSS